MVSSAANQLDAVHSDPGPAECVDAKTRGTLCRLNDLSESLAQDVQSIRLDIEDTSDGFSFLDVKNNALLESAIATIGIVQLRTGGIQDGISENLLQEIIGENRIVLDKIRVMETKFKYRMEKLLKAATSGETTEDGELSLAPNLDAFDLSSSGSSVDDALDGDDATDGEILRYEAPRVAAAPYMEPSAKEKRRKQRELERLRESRLFRDATADSASDSGEDPNEIWDLGARVDRGQGRDDEALEMDAMRRIGKRKKKPNNSGFIQEDLMDLADFGALKHLERLPDTVQEDVHVSIPGITKPAARRPTSFEAEKSLLNKNGPRFSNPRGGWRVGRKPGLKKRRKS